MTQTPKAYAVNVDLFALAQALPSASERAATYGEGASRLRDSLAHASMLYSKGYVDDSNGAEIALILGVLACHGDQLIEWLGGAESTLHCAHEDDGVMSVNHITQSPFPSFDHSDEFAAYMTRMQTVNHALRLAFTNPSKTSA